MPACSHRLALVLTGPEKKDLGQFPVEQPDWAPAREAAQFELLKRSGRSASVVTDSDLMIEAIFGDRGAPWMEGFIVSFGTNGERTNISLPNAACVRSAARAISARLVSDKKVESGDLVTYQVVAYPADEPRKTTGGASAFEETAILPPLRESPEGIGGLLGRCADVPAHGSGTDDDTDPNAESDSLPIFVPESLFAEIRPAAEAVQVETGGLLIGILHRYPVPTPKDNGDSPEYRIAAEITAQIPAQFTEASGTSLRFTDESWTAVDRALRLRKMAGTSPDEIILGWWHSHPARTWCPETCPIENRLTCPKQAPFFSVDDLALHREVFPKAHHIALLVNVADSGTGVSAFGWEKGVVCPRPYWILDPDTETSGERMTDAPAEVETSHP